MEYKKNIGIYGGAFNPIHTGHLILAQSAMEEYSLEKVLFAVSSNPPHKTGIESFEHRFAMTELAVKNCPKFEVTDIEKEIEGRSYTYCLIEKIKEKYGMENNYFLIIGEDEANYFNNWFRYEDILKMCRVVVGHRGTELPKNSIEFEFLKTPFIEISSSDIRKRAKEGRSLLYYTEKSVADYIKENKLYLKD